MDQARLISVLDAIDFETFEEASGEVDGLLFTLRLTQSPAIPLRMVGDWRDLVVRNATQLLDLRQRDGLESAEMSTGFPHKGKNWIINLMISELPAAKQLQQPAASARKR